MLRKPHFERSFNVGRGEVGKTCPACGERYRQGQRLAQVIRSNAGAPGDVLYVHSFCARKGVEHFDSLFLATNIVKGLDKT